VYVFNKGLDDFRAPLEELFAVLQNSQKESATALGYVSFLLIIPVSYFSLSIHVLFVNSKSWQKPI